MLSNFVRLFIDAVPLVEDMPNSRECVYFDSCFGCNRVKDNINSCIYYFGGAMDFLYVNDTDYATGNFDALNEIVTRDSFLKKWTHLITNSEETLLHRQALFSDILKFPELEMFFVTLYEKLSEFAPLINIYKQADSHEERLHNILYPTAYIELIEFIQKALHPIINDISSSSVRSLFDTAENDINSLEYQHLKLYYEKNSNTLCRVRSVTIGVNLDAVYQPKEAGIISLNEEEFKSGNLLDRIIRLDFAKDEYHCIAPLTTIDNKLGYQESQYINHAVLKAIGRILESGLQFCSNNLLKYVKGKLVQLFSLHDSLGFVVDAIKRIKCLKEKGIPLCFPEINHEGDFRFISLYDCSLSHVKDKMDIVPNTVHLSAGTHCYILTGPNSGGKTVFINSVAFAQFYFQLGMPIPAKKAALPLCDAIYMMAGKKRVAVYMAGDFENECMVIAEILKQSTNRSLILIDEAFASTSALEAVPIAVNFISKLCNLGGKCVFITHLSELLASVGELSELSEKVGYLHTEMQGERRNYSVRTGRSASGSHAISIAQKYGLLQKNHQQYN